MALRGITLNTLNPKLTLFFLAFLPQFITPGSLSPTQQLLGLSAVFMLMTAVVFCIYALLAGGARTTLSAMPRATRWIQRSVAAIFAVWPWRWPSAGADPARVGPADQRTPGSV